MKKLLLLIALSVSVYGKAQSSCIGTVFASGPNALSTGGSITTYVQNCLTYNADLNTVLWTHRASPYWNFAGYTSGCIQTTWLNVTTNVWDSMIIYTDSANNHHARYPGGTIFNPAGNTGISNAYMVGTGPVTDGTNWTGAWYSSRQPNGNYHAVTSVLIDSGYCQAGFAPFGNMAAPNNSGGPHEDIQQVGNMVLVAGDLGDNTYAASDNIPVKGGVVGKATYTGSGFTWSADSIIPGFYVGTLGYLNMNNTRIAFSPNGQIGYVVFIGRLATNFGNNADSTLSPIVYKSTNGGASWSAQPILPGFDWTTGHPEMLKNVGYITNQKKPNQFMPFAQHGIDVTVDSLGTLHLVSVVTAPMPTINSTIDSIAAYMPSYHWDYQSHHPIIWDMMTDGTTWNTILIDSLKTSEMSGSTTDTTSSGNPWATTTALGYGARIQVSRSTTGGKLFYSWTDSDSSITHTLYNSIPDIYMKSYDISNQIVTPTSNVTSGNGRCYFHYLSDVSYYDNNIGGWVCPLVYTTALNTTPPFFVSDTVHYNYLNCANFYTSQYNTPASVYRTQGPQGISSYANNTQVIKVYPNPSNGIIYLQALSKNQTSLDVQLTDIVGKEIKHETLYLVDGKTSLDIRNLNSGVYFITAKTAGGTDTQKIILQH
jgi:hypothetical protein